MEEERAAVESALTNFGAKLDAVETALRPLLAAVDVVRSGGGSDDVPPLMQARVDATLAYTLNAIFCMYLRTQGQDPTEHPVRDEIARVRSAYLRIQEIDKGRRSKPRKRSHASLYVAEEALANVLTDGERALHLAANGKLGPLSDVGTKTVFINSSDGEGEDKVERGAVVGDSDDLKTPKATKRKRSVVREDSNEGSDSDSPSSDGSDSVATAAAAAEAESVRKEKKRPKKEKRERTDKREEMSVKKTSEFTKKESESLEKSSKKRLKKSLKKSSKKDQVRKSEKKSGKKK